MITIDGNRIDLDDQSKSILFNILKAYSNYDTKVKYCQGLNFIVGMILVSLKAEQAVFWILVQVMYKSKWRGLYKKKMPRLVEILDKFTTTIKKSNLELYKHFEKKEVYL